MDENGNELIVDTGNGREKQFASTPWIAVGRNAEKNRRIEVQKFVVRPDNAFQLVQPDILKLTETRRYVPALSFGNFHLSLREKSPFVSSSSKELAAGIRDRAGVDFDKRVALFTADIDVGKLAAPRFELPELIGRNNISAMASGDLDSDGSDELIIGYISDRIDSSQGSTIFSSENDDTPLNETDFIGGQMRYAILNFEGQNAPLLQDADDN